MTESTEPDAPTTTVDEVRAAYDAGYAAGTDPNAINPYASMKMPTYFDTLEPESPRKMLLAGMWRNGYRKRLAEISAELKRRHGIGGTSDAV